MELNLNVHTQINKKITLYYIFQQLYFISQETAPNSLFLFLFYFFCSMYFYLARLNASSTI